MKKHVKGLFFKIYSLILLPSVAFLILGALYVWDNYETYTRNDNLQTQIPIIRSAVNLLSVMQVERGMSIAYVNGANNWDKLQNHRRLVDEKFNNYKSKSQEIEDPKLSNNSLSLIASALNLRDKIKNKQVGKKEIAPTYTKSIRNLMGKMTDLMNIAQNPEILKTLININELSEAKENGGLLRANLSAILARKSGISPKELDFILTLKSKFYGFSNSSSIKVFSQESQKLLTNFKKGPEHSIIASAINEVIADTKATQYSIGSNEYFKTISDSLGKLHVTILNEISYLEVTSLSHLQSARTSLIFMVSIILGYLVLGSIFTSIVVLRLVRDFRKNLHTLNNKTLAISLATDHLNTYSKNVSDASSSQAQDIEGTSSAVHEINKIQESTSNLIIDSKKLTSQAADDADKGMKQIKEMLNSINKISDSNKDLAQQVRENNESFEKVTNVINEIADKTGIINDIVFQTKLLSFNASVEAARAGEHGKGFSVVAEEIGQLANLSGNAANEIAALVSNSIDLVSRMTKEMTHKMDGFVSNSNQNIEAGNKDAQHCNKLFSKMVQAVDKLENSMIQIESAALEQGEAIANISKNINQLDAATKTNLNTISENFKLSENISTSSKELKDVVDEMCIIIRGEIIKDKDVKLDLDQMSISSNLALISNSTDQKEAA